MSKFSLLIYAAGLLLLTLAILLTTYVRTPFDIGFAVKTTLYCFLILFAYGIVELLNCRRMVKLGIDSILTGAFFVSLAKVLPALMQVEEENYFDVDFLDWAGHSNGNVAVLILTLFTIGGILLIVFGARGRQKA